MIQQDWTQMETKTPLLDDVLPVFDIKCRQDKNPFASDEEAILTFDHDRTG